MGPIPRCTGGTMIGQGCGCQTGIFKYLPIPEADYFYIPCCIHDDDYDRGVITRKTADMILLAGCLQTIERDQAIGKLRKAWLKMVAYGYYTAVRLFGWAYYKK